MMSNMTIKRSILLPALFFSALVAMPVLLVVWLMIPCDSLADAPKLRVEGLQRRIMKLPQPSVGRGNDGNPENMSPGQVALQQRCHALLGGLMDDCESWTLDRQDLEGDKIVASNALRAGEIAGLYDRDVRIRSSRFDGLSVRHLSFLYQILQHLVMNTRRGLTSADQYLVIDPATELQQMGERPTHSKESSNFQDIARISQGDTVFTESPGDDPARSMDLSMQRTVITAGVNIVANELEQLVPAAKFLKMTGWFVGWNPVNEKLRKMLSPGPDVNSEMVRKWEEDFREFRFPLELLAADPSFEWKSFLSHYIRQRSNELLESYRVTCDWPGIREQVGQAGHDHFVAQVIAGIPVKLGRKRRFRASMNWAEDLAEHIADFNSFRDFESFHLSSNREEILHLAEHVRPWIQNRLLVAACILKGGGMPGSDEPVLNDYLKDPYTGEPFKIEARTRDADRLQVMLISSGPDLVSIRDRRTWEDDIQISVVLDRNHPILSRSGK